MANQYLTYYRTFKKSSIATSQSTTATLKQPHINCIVSVSTLMGTAISSTNAGNINSSVTKAFVKKFPFQHPVRQAYEALREIYTVREAV